MLFYLSSVESINYPSSLKYVRLRAFEGTQITNGILPDGLSIIEDGAFAKTKINVLSLPNNPQGNWALLLLIHVII